MTRTMIVAALAALAVGCQRNTQPDDTMDNQEIEQQEPIGQQDQQQDQPDQQEVQEVVLIPVGVIVATPGTWSGMRISGTAEIGEVVSNRGFWLQEGDSRLFAVVIDQPEEDPIALEQGQTVQIDDATVRTAQDMEQIPGEPLEPTAEEIIQQQGVFLLVDEANITIVEEPGT